MNTFWKQKQVWGKPRKTKPEDKAWRNFSLYIRTRDALKTMGRIDIGRCVTCKKIVTVKGNDCGHYVSRANKITKYLEQNSHLQCHYCNGYLSGNMIEYRKAMVAMYGEEYVRELENMKGIHKEYTDWEAESKKWIAKRKELLANHKI